MPGRGPGAPPVPPVLDGAATEDLPGLGSGPAWGKIRGVPSPPSLLFEELAAASLSGLDRVSVSLVRMNVFTKKGRRGRMVANHKL